MNSRQLNLVLTAMVLGLLGTILIMISWTKDRHTPEIIDRTNYVANTVTQITVKKFNATNLLAALARRQVGWEAIESTNYMVYIFNLRTLGCPEETIRDIIIADVAKMFAEQREAILSQVPAIPYWQPVRNAYGFPDPVAQEQLSALQDDMRRLVRELLGVSYDAEIAKFDLSFEPVARLAGVFPQKTRRQIEGILDYYAGMEESIRREGGDVLLPADQQALQEIELQKQQELSQILNPEEMRTYELYMSPLAEQMRYELYGFDPSEEEFVEIFNLRKSFNTVLDSTINASQTLGPQLRQEVLEEAQLTLANEIQSVLGEDRYQNYLRATDPEYQELLRWSDRVALPEGAVNEVYSLRQSAEQQKNAVLANADLTYHQQREAVDAIMQETEKALADAMGSEQFANYRQVGGDWLAELGETPLSLDNLANLDSPQPAPTAEPPPPDQVPPEPMAPPLVAPLPFYLPPQIPPPLPNPVPQ